MGSVTSAKRRLEKKKKRYSFGLGAEVKLYPDLLLPPLSVGISSVVL